MEKRIKTDKQKGQNYRYWRQSLNHSEKQHEAVKKLINSTVDSESTCLKALTNARDAGVLPNDLLKMLLYHVSVGYHFKHSKCFSLLIDWGCDINLNAGFTPSWSMIHVAARVGDLKLVKKLWKCDAIMENEDILRFTPIAYSIAKKNHDCLLELLKIGGKIDPRVTSKLLEFQQSEIKEFVIVLWKVLVYVENFEAELNEFLHSQGVGQIGGHLAEFCFDKRSIRRSQTELYRKFGKEFCEKIIEKENSSYCVIN